MFDRLELLIEKENLSKIRTKKVLIVGIGGVGGTAITSLVRSGIENVVLVDYDTVDISNINRQMVAYQSTIGKKKIAVMEKILKEINNNCQVKKYDLFLNKDNVKELLDKENPDYIIDACDFTEAKKEIIMESLKRKIKFITAMGTGNRLNSSLLEITDIRKTSGDPLARIIRKWVKDNNIKGKIPTVASREVAKKTGRVVASSCFVPNCAGLLMASYIICDIINKEEV